MQYVKLVGAQFKSHGVGTFTTEIKKPDHPIMSGFKGFETWDETYVHHKGTDDRNILQTRRRTLDLDERTGQRSSILHCLWARSKNLGNPGFHDLVYRGLLWAIGEKNQKIFSL